MTKVNTTRCSPMQMRKMLQIVEALKSAGMEFVPVPVLNEDDRDKLLAFTASRLDKLASAAEGNTDA